MRVFTLVYLVTILGFHRCQCGLSSGGGESSPDGVSKGPKGATLRTPVAKQEANNNEDKAESTASKALKQQSRGLETTIPNPGSLETSSERYKPSSTISTGGTFSTHSVEGSSSGQSTPLIPGACKELTLEEKSRELAKSIKARLARGPLIYDPTQEQRLDTTTEHSPDTVDVEDGRCEGGTHVVESSNDETPDSALTTRYYSYTSNNVKLNVDNIDENLFTVQDFPEKGGLSTKTLTPKHPYLLTEIREKTLYIWKGEEDGHAKTVLVYYDGERPVSLVLNYVDAHGNTTSSYHNKKYGSWIVVGREEYESTLTNTRRLASILKLMPTKLDVSFIDKSVFTVIDSKEDDLLKKIVTVNTDYRVVEVSHGQETVWKADDKEYGRSVTLYYNGDSPTFAIVKFVKVDGKTTLQYYNRKDGQWAQVKKVVFDIVLTETKRVTSLLKLKPIKLNVASVDGTMFTIQDSTDGNLPTKILSPEDEYRLMEVSENATLIWKGVDIKEHCKSILLYHDDESPILATVRFVKSDGKNDLQYCSKNGDKWSQVNRKDFEKALANIRRIVFLLKLTPVKLDVSKIDGTIFTIQDSPDEGVPVKTLTPKGDYRVVEVSDSSASIWSAHDKEHCKSAWVYYDHDNIPALVILDYVLKDGMDELRYYSKKGGKWTQVSKEDYESTLTNMKRITSLLKLTPAKLDIVAFDMTMFTIEDFKEDDVPIKIIAPRYGHRLTEVLDMDLPIWKGEDNTEHSDTVTLYYDRGKAVLLLLSYVLKNGEDKTIYRYRDEDRWIPIERNNFVKALANIKRIISLLKLKATSLDISSIDEDLFILKDFYDGDVPLKVLIPKISHRLVRVKDTRELIWKSEGGMHYCKAVLLHYDEGRPVLAVILSYLLKDGKGTTLYRYKDDKGQWKDGTGADHKRELTKLKEKSTPITPLTLNLTHPDPSIYQSFDYSFAGNAIKLIVPNKDVTIARLVAGVNIIWKVKPEEKLEYARVYLNKDGKPELVHLVLRSSGTIRDHYMELIFEKWMDYIGDPSYKIKSLAITVTRVSDITIGISTTGSNGYYTTFEVELLGVATKHFFPKPGYNATWVKNGTSSLWIGKAHSLTLGSPDDHCLSCIIYTKDGAELLEMDVVENHSRGKRCYRKLNGEWKEMSLDIFNEIMKNMTEPDTLDISSPNTSSIDKHTRMPYEMVQTIYYPKNGYRMTSVADFGVEIWKAPDGHACKHATTIRFRGKTDYSEGVIKFLFIYARDTKGMMKSFYYEKVEYIWSSTTEEAFYRRFHAEAVKGSVIDAITLDIKGDNDPVQFYVTNTSGLPFIAYAPNVGYSVKRVMDNSRALWEAKSEDQECLYTSLYPREAPTLAYLVIHTLEGLKELFFKRFVELWVDIQKDEYLERLEEAGLDPSTFSNEITVDIARPDKELCYISGSQIYGYAVDMHVVSVGFRLRTIVDDGEEVWKAEEGEHCTYINLVLNDNKPFAFFILIDDPKNGRSVLYFVKDDGVWKNVKKEDYHAFIPARLNGMNLPRMENQKIIMSSFRNKQGLRLTSYASTVDNSRGDIVLCHGIRSYFISEFSTSNVEWNYERFGSPAFLNINGLFLNESSHKRHVVEIYRHLFEHGSLDGMDVLGVLPAYEYEGSLIEFFNKLGYNVYGLDLQSHGLSEAQTEKKCYVKDFKDYVYDVMQFVSIIKRGAFNDSTEKWNEEFVYGNHPTDHKTILMGNSMGGNVVVQAVQEFYRHVNNPNAKLVDGIIVTSGMFNIDHYLDTFKKKFAKTWLNTYNEDELAKTNTYETPLNYGEYFDFFLRHRGPFFNTSRLTFKATKLAFDACDDVRREESMVHYPKDLPTLLFHSRDDVLCDVKGPRDLMNKYFKGNQNAKFLELDGSVHYLTIPQAMVALQPYLKEWLDKYTTV